jgi:hypothetical protein
VRALDGFKEVNDAALYTDRREGRGRWRST